VTEDLVFIFGLNFKGTQNRQMIVQDFLFRKCGRGICRVAKWIVNTYFLYQSFSV